MQHDVTASSVGEPLLITAAELASMMRISLRSLWRMRSAGQLPQPIRFGGTVRWRLSDVKSWIAEGCPQPESRENERRRV